MNGNVVISVVDAVVYVVLSEAKKNHVPYGGISWYYGMYDVISWVSH